MPDLEYGQLRSDKRGACRVQKRTWDKYGQAGWGNIWRAAWAQIKFEPSDQYSISKEKGLGRKKWTEAVQNGKSY